MAKHNELGKEGELQAIAFLKGKGYHILQTNYRYLKHEVDIIAQINGLIVVVEVKTRTSKDFGELHDFVKPNQIKSIVTATDAYLQELDKEYEVRFDIVTVYKTENKFELEHIEDAFNSII